MNETNEQQSLDLLSSEQLGEALEAVLFASGHPLSFEKLAQTFQKTEKEMRCFAEEYAKAYNQSSRGILFLILDDSCQLCSKEEYKEYIRTAMGIKSSGKLSASCLEALAIIAYNQPVTKAYVEQIRGVDCSWAIGTLCDKHPARCWRPKGTSLWQERLPADLSHRCLKSSKRCWRVQAMKQRKSTWMPSSTNRVRISPGQWRDPENAEQGLFLFRADLPAVPGIRAS